MNPQQSYPSQVRIPVKFRSVPSGSKPSSSLQNNLLPIPLTVGSSSKHISHFTAMASSSSSYSSISASIPSSPILPTLPSQVNHRRKSIAHKSPLNNCTTVSGRTNVSDLTDWCLGMSSIDVGNRNLANDRSDREWVGKCMVDGKLVNKTGSRWVIDDVFSSCD